MKKAEAAAAMAVARAQWDEALAQIAPEGMETPGEAGAWSVKNLVAHIAWFEREMAELLRQRVLAGSDWWNLPSDERNARIYEENRQRPLADVLAEARHSYADLAAALEGASDADLNDAARFRAMPADWLPWKILAENSWEHREAHLPALHALLQK